MKSFKLLIFTIVLIFSFFAEAKNSASKKRYRKKQKISAGLEGSYDSFFNLKEEDTKDSLYNFTFSFKFRHKFNKNFGLMLSPKLDFSEVDNHLGDRFVLRSENTGLFFSHKKIRLSAGLLSHSFGLSQAFSPINFIDMASYVNPIDPKKISNPSVRLTYKTKSLRVFSTFFPKRFKNALPGENTPWIPTSAPGSLFLEGRELILPERINYSFGGDFVFDEALKNNFVFGVRHKTKKTISQFIYYNGVDTDPTLDLNLNLTTVDATPGAERLNVEPDIVLNPVYQKIKRYGLSFRYTLPIKWRLLYEASYSEGNPNQRQGFRRSQTHTAGLEWGLPVGDKLLLGVLQTFRNFNPDASSVGLVSPFREAYLVGLSMKVNKKLNAQAGWFSSKSLQVDLYTMELSYRFHRKMKASLSSTVIEGQVLELLSAVLDRDTARFKLQLLW